MSQGFGFSVGNDDFQKGAEKKSEGLGLNAGILKANQVREDRIKEEKIKFAKYLIDKMDIIRIVLDNVNRGRNSAVVQFPPLWFDPRENEKGFFAPNRLLADYDKCKTEAIDSDGITWSGVMEEIQKMMAAEGVGMKAVVKYLYLHRETGEVSWSKPTWDGTRWTEYNFYEEVHLKWDNPNGS